MNRTRKQILNDRYENTETPLSGVAAITFGALMVGSLAIGMYAFLSGVLNLMEQSLRAAGLAM